MLAKRRDPNLALTEIASGGGLPGANVHFADSGDSRALEFDYRLRPGMLNGSNALKLVRLLGIGPEGEAWSEG